MTRKTMLSVTKALDYIILHNPENLSNEYIQRLIDYKEFIYTK